MLSSCFFAKLTIDIVFNRADRWRDCEQLFILTQREEDGINHLLLNLSESQLVQDPHLISFTDYHDAFAYTQLLRANGDESDFR